jgi:hypothetical protein
MSFLKLFILSGILWIGFVVPSGLDEQQDYFKVLVPKAMVISAATGVMSGLIDKYVFCPVGFITEIGIRKLVLDELFFSNKKSVNEFDKNRYARQRDIAGWFGWGASWIAWGITFNLLSTK